MGAHTALLCTLLALPLVAAGGAALLLASNRLSRSRKRQQASKSKVQRQEGKKASQSLVFSPVGAGGIRVPMGAM